MPVIGVRELREHTAEVLRQVRGTESGIHHHLPGQARGIFVAGG